MYEKGNTAEKLDQEEQKGLGPQEEVQKPPEPPASEKDDDPPAFDYSEFSDEFDRDDAEEEFSGSGEVEEPPVTKEEEGKEEPPPPQKPDDSTSEKEEEKKPESDETQEEELKEEKKPEDKEEKEEEDETLYDPDSQKPPETQEEYQKRLAEARKAAEEELIGKYNLSEDEADEFLSDPQKAVPKMMAKVYLDTYQQVLTDVRAMVPNIVQQVQNQVKQVDQAKEEFYGLFPDLKGLDDQVEHVANLYLQQAQAQGRKISKKELYRNVGVQVSVMNQKPIPPGILGQEDTAVKQEETPAPANPQPQSQAWTPSNPGQPNTPTGAGHSEQKPGLWEQLATEEEDWDDD